MTEKEQLLCERTSKLLGKDTSKMTLNNIIEELADLLEKREAERQRVIEYVTGV